MSMATQGACLPIVYPRGKYTTRLPVAIPRTRPWLHHAHARGITKHRRMEKPWACAWCSHAHIYQYEMYHWNWGRHPPHVYMTQQSVFIVRTDWMKHRDAMWDGLDGIGRIFPDGGRCRAPYGADKLQHQSEIHMATFIFLHSCTFMLHYFLQSPEQCTKE